MRPRGPSSRERRRAAERLRKNTPTSSQSRRLFHLTVNDFVEQRHAVGLGPQSDLSGVAEGRIFDLEELLAVVEHDVVLEQRSMATVRMIRHSIDAIYRLPGGSENAYQDVTWPCRRCSGWAWP